MCVFACVIARWVDEGPEASDKQCRTTAMVGSPLVCNCECGQQGRIAESTARYDLLCNSFLRLAATQVEYCGEASRVQVLVRCCQAPGSYYKN